MGENDATAEELLQLFLALGVDPGSADIAAQSILDWRDEDDLHRARGAEWDDYYRHQTPAVLPANGPFTDLEELRHVRSMGELFPRAAPYLSVLGDGRINLNTAPEPVLRTLPGLTDEGVGVVLARRRTGPPLRELAELEANLSPPARRVLQRNLAALARRAASEPSALEIAAVGWAEGTPLRRTLRALAVRIGSDVQVVWRVER